MAFQSSMLNPFNVPFCSTTSGGTTRVATRKTGAVSFGCPDAAVDSANNSATTSNP
jgi:hypothetical protein